MVKVTTRDHPILKDVICMKGAYAPKHFAHPDRILYPLKRVGARGDGQWERVTWDEAMDDIAERLRAVIDKYGPEAFAVGQRRRHRPVRPRPLPALHEPCRLAELDQRRRLLRRQHGRREPLCLWLVPARRRPELQMHRAARPRPAPAQLDDGIQGDPHGAGRGRQAHRGRSAPQRERRARRHLAAAPRRHRRGPAARLAPGHRR